MEHETTPLPECRMHEALRSWLGSLESCHDYHGQTVAEIDYQPLLAAVYTAFNHHRPLILTPDAVWLTIAQGLAHHMAVHGERLRSRFVAHQGRLDLVFECRDWVERSPENPWPAAFASWAGQIRTHVGAETHDTLLCNFSTSGPTERAVSQIVMMDIFDRYFHYTAVGICGIPNITLDGTPADWKLLAAKVEHLTRFDIDWWLDDLQRLCAQFCRASQGDIDLFHWRNICKLRTEYGGHIINGWIARLFPYLREYYDGPCTRVNPIFATGEGFQTLFAPSGLSQVPFVWRNEQTGRERLMEAIGGLVAITQDKDTLALRPKIGWAVREAASMDTILARLSREHRTFPPMRPGQGGTENAVCGPELPPDLSKFYHRTNGAELYSSSAEIHCVIVGRDQLWPLDWGEEGNRAHLHAHEGRSWHRLARLPDGSWLAVNLDLNRSLAPWQQQPELCAKVKAIGHEQFAPICHIAAVTLNKPGPKPVIALSFTELCQRLLECGDLYWLKPPFVSYGDAELFTRRKKR